MRQALFGWIYHIYKSTVIQQTQQKLNDTTHMQAVVRLSSVPLSNSNNPNILDLLGLAFHFGRPICPGWSNGKGNAITRIVTAIGLEEFENRIT